MLVRLIQEGFLFAVAALWGNRLRTVLSLLGITIGIFAVISVFTFVDSWEMRIRSSLSSLGDEVVYLEKWPWAFGSDYAWWKYMSRPVASYREFELLRERTTTAAAMTMTTGLNGNTAKAGSLSVNSAKVNAVSHDYQDLRSFELTAGRYFSATESQLGSRVVVMGASVAEALFPGINPIGREIQVIGQKLRVIGVLAKEGNNAINMSLDNEFLVPLNLVRKVRGGDFAKLYPLIMIQPKANIPVNELKAEVRGHMRAIRRIRPTEEDNFALNQVSFLANQLGQLFSALTVIGWLVGGFSILVGGFGIANIMFVSVYERTSQIGIQKALGAKRYFILLQFLIESVVLSLMGGLLGLLVVWLMTLLATHGFDLELTLTGGNVLLAISVSVIIGVIAGLLPALRASRMDPVEAIRFN
jgi:putative ABC transport system permease protein